MAEEKPQVIEKPWAVYGWFLGAWDLGRIVEESEDSKNTVLIQYWDEQTDSPACWKSKFVKRFDTSSEAINYLFENQSLGLDSVDTKEEIFRRVLYRFPTAMKQEVLQTFNDTLVAYQNKLSSQTLPKCTPAQFVDLDNKPPYGRTWRH
jgi:hypothetical protein